MIADASTIDRSAFDRSFDVCVIGAGPAGITLARRLAAAGASVALMEAGGLEITEESQDVYRGTNLGQEYFDLDICPPALLRRHLEPLGRLEPRPRRRRLHAAALGPALRLADRASSTSTPTAPRPTPSSTCPPPAEAPDLPVRQTGYDFHRFQFRFSPPTRFAEKYQAEIEASDRHRARPQRQPRRPPPRRRALHRHRRGLPQLRPRRPRLHRHAPAPTRSAPAASRTPASCSTSPARSPRASATAPAGSAAASPTTRTS